MIKALFIISTLLSSLFAKEYMTQIKPYESIEVKSQVSGIVSFVNTKAEGKFINSHDIIVKLDAKDEQIDLEAQTTLLQSQKNIVNIREKNYKAKAKIKQLSQYDKNNEKISYLDAKKELINTQKNIRTLKNTINKKTFIINAQYIGDIQAKKGAYIDVGDIVFNAYDISKLKITLYLTKEEIEKLSQQAVYINGEKSLFKVENILNIKDSVKISRYKVEFTAINEKLENYFFDSIVKVELK